MNQIRRLLELEFTGASISLTGLSATPNLEGFGDSSSAPRSIFTRGVCMAFAAGMFCSSRRKDGKPVSHERRRSDTFSIQLQVCTTWWPVGRGRPIGIGTRWHSPRFESPWAVRRSMPLLRGLMIKRWPNTLPLMRSAIHSLSVCI